MFASRLLQDEKMPPKPDLASHSLIHFLDRFVYRNSKTAVASSRGGSIMQPLSGGDSRVLVSNRGTQKKQEPVNSEAFWRKKAEDVSVDEVFFHKYFTHIGKGKQVSNKKKAPAKHADGADNEDEENEDEIWQALVDSRPEVEGGSDEDSDMEMLDLDDSDAASSISDEDGEEGEEVDFEPAGSEVSDEGMEGAPADSQSDAGSDMDELFEKELKAAREADDGAEETSRQKKRRMKSLPTFASAEDYAEMLDNDEDEDL
jgi:ribosome biogenesis protein MAK21